MVRTRQLTDEERESARHILERTRKDIEDAAEGDASLIWAIRRYIYKQLTYDERGTPTERRKLKDLKWKEQRGKCARCSGDLPIKGAELDRIDPMNGYKWENVRLLCHKCHREEQEERGFQ